MSLKLKRVQTSELAGEELDWMVTRAEGAKVVNDYGRMKLQFPNAAALIDISKLSPFITTKNYSTNWKYGGPIIEDEGMTIGKVAGSKTEWGAEMCQSTDTKVSHLSFGPTPLVAAMRCLVASRFGDEVEVPTRGN